MTLPGDGTEYELLTDAARRTTVPGLVCEVGTRLGGGIQAMIDGLTSPRVILSIDPYGDWKYAHSDSNPELWECGYDRDMMIEALRTIPAACHAKGHLWLPYPMDDGEFFNRFTDGVPLYATEKIVCNEYALVHLDGPHTTQAVYAETLFFGERVALGGAVVYDNWDYFDNALIAKGLTAHGFIKEAEGQSKVAWRKV